MSLFEADCFEVLLIAAKSNIEMEHLMYKALVFNFYNSTIFAFGFAIHVRTGKTDKKKRGAYSIPF
jgi:hypothetical protein